MNDPAALARMALWRRMSRSEAQTLVAEAGRHRSIRERIARARGWMVLEVYEPAWNELAALSVTLRPGRLRARVCTDLVILSYYLSRDVDEARLQRDIERDAGTDRPILADLHLGLALRATARNDLHNAVRELHVGLDLAKLEPADQRELLALRRVQAHVLGQAGVYVDALQSADDAVSLAHSIDDEWELARSRYSKGFVLWCAGRIRDAVGEFDQALDLTRDATSAFPRWIRCCRARSLAQLGRVEEAERDLAWSSHQLPEDLGYIAIIRGQLEVAIDHLQPHISEGDPSVIALLGIARCLSGQVTAGLDLLQRSQVMFSEGGLMHFALAAQVHLGFAKEQQRRGSGRMVSRKAAEELVRRGARGFAWPHPAVISWLRDELGAERSLASFATSETPLGGSLVPAMALRSMGLTAREVEIALRLGAEMASSTVGRAELAQELGISPNTLRVHIMRIRDKLDISGRGDTAVARAISTITIKGLTP